jgi:hypothetical protein
MGTIAKLQPVKLIIGIIYKEEKNLIKTQARLCRMFGKADFVSEDINFDFTDYYEKEMGKALKRRFLSFNRLINPERLPHIKVKTNALESRFLKCGARQINIDPGYLDMAKLVLASTKDYSHRIYLNRGIFAEVTLFYQNHSFRPRDWTYPDYRTDKYIEIFNRIRQIYDQQADKK